MAGKQKHNWQALKTAYVSGDINLRELSREHTGLDSSPSYQTLRHRSCAEDWEGQRKAFRHNLSTQTATTPTAQQVLQNTELLVDSAEAIARHIQLSKSLQATYIAIQGKIKHLRIIEEMDFSTLKPLELSLLLQRLAMVIATAADLERKAMGLSDPVSKTEAEVKFVVAMPEESKSIEQWSEQWSQALRN